jgi:hypothetical protein
MVASTQKGEDLTDFIKTVTKSDELALEIESPPPEAVLPAPTEPAKSKPTGILSRYSRKPRAIKTVIRDLDKTERLNSKFLLARKQRTEELERFAEKERLIVEKKQKDFIASLEFEAEKHRREAKVAEEIKNSKPPTMAEMLNQIRTKRPDQPPARISLPKPADYRPPRAWLRSKSESSAHSKGGHRRGYAARGGGGPEDSLVKDIPGERDQGPESRRRPCK